jgi:ketosteroid isomerase-like protein
MSSEDNKALYRRGFEEVWNKGNLAVVDEHNAANVVTHTPPGPPLQGTEAFKQFIQMYRSAFLDVQFTIEDQIAEGDKVGRAGRRVAPTRANSWGSPQRASRRR